MTKKTSLENDGVKSPHTFQVPDIIIDRIAGVITAAEFKVLMYIVRRTSGFNKRQDRVSLSQFMNGITTKSGKILDAGLWMGEKTVKTALAGLKQFRIIQETQPVDRSKSLPPEYAMSWEDEIDWTGLESRKRSEDEKLDVRNEKLKVTPYAQLKTSTPPHQNGTLPNAEKITENQPNPPHQNGTLPPPPNGTPQSNSIKVTEELSKDSESFAFDAPPPRVETSTKKTAKAPKAKKQPKVLSPEEIELDRKSTAILTAYSRTVLAGIPARGIGSYKINWGRELAAAKSLATEDWTPEQVVSCYISLKSESFWSSKHLALVSVEKQIGAYHANLSNSIAASFTHQLTTNRHYTESEPTIPGVASRTVSPANAYRPSKPVTFESLDAMLSEL